MPQVNLAHKRKHTKPIRFFNMKELDISDGNEFTSIKIFFEIFIY